MIETLLVTTVGIFLAVLMFLIQLIPFILIIFVILRIIKNRPKIDINMITKYSNFLQKKYNIKTFSDIDKFALAKFKDLEKDFIILYQFFELKYSDLDYFYDYLCSNIGNNFTNLIVILDKYKLTKTSSALKVINYDLFNNSFIEDKELRKKKIFGGFKDEDDLHLYFVNVGRNINSRNEEDAVLTKIAEM